MTHEEQLVRARDILGGPRGPIHMMGVAGVGMAGLAVQLAARGFKVTGCDGITFRKGKVSWTGGPK